MDIEIEFRQYAELMQVASSLGMEPMALTAIAKAMGAGKTAIDITKAMTDLVGKTQNAELIDQMADLKLAMADLKIALADAKEETLEFQARNKELEKQLAEAKSPKIKLVRKEGSRFYYKEDSTDDTPYCPQCWDNEQKLSVINKIETMFTCSVSCGFMGDLRKGE